MRYIKIERVKDRTSALERAGYIEGGRTDIKGNHVGFALYNLKRTVRFGRYPAA
jgi:hypothetical protein